jgi:Lipocalin-like domain
MNRRCALGLYAIGLVTISAFPSSSVAQEKLLGDQVVGTWIYVSSTARRDNGSSVQRPSFKGTATYTADGRFQLKAARTDAPEYRSGDPAHPSSDEALAASKSITYTGTYTVDENTKTIHANIETSTFPNFVGATDLRRIIKSITADEMSLTNLDTPGLTIDTVWKRAK